jgi:DNA-directed RNA polymerase subunit M/transcription elongation factor TFIIS
MALKYRNKNEYILSPTDPQIFKEIRAMVEYQEFRDILDFLTDAPSRSYIMWDQEIMDEGRIAVEKEITIQRYEEIGVKGVGKCKYCTSTELIFVQKQINSGDEPMRVFVRCVACQKHWRM